MTTEEKAIKQIREKYFVNGDGKIRQAHPLREQDIAVLMIQFHNSQPPNLICGGGGQVIDSDYVESLIFEITQLTKENQELIKENKSINNQNKELCIKIIDYQDQITQLTKENQELKTSLQQEKSRWVRTKGILIDTELKLKAVTKENQELKVYPKLLEDYKRGKNLEINDIKQQLQAAEDRIKEVCELLIDPLTGLCQQQFENIIGKEACVKIELLTNKQ